MNTYIFNYFAGLVACTHSEVIKRRILYGVVALTILAGLFVAWKTVTIIRKSHFSAKIKPLLNAATVIGLLLLALLIDVIVLSKFDPLCW